MDRYVCIHGHFYQPPRENPWLDEVEQQDSARPFHDWNQRITSECYWPNAVARILADDGFITRIKNNYRRISFNFGPTLLSWMQRAHCDVYRAILEADVDSRKRFSGHGSALAQAYNHIILPLANRRDKITQVRWGVRDFESRFGRAPEGMWLPETAADTETLEILVQEGIAFTVLAPRQAARVRRIGDADFHDVTGGGLDTRRPYRVSLPSGRSIAVFFYDGPASQAVAFEQLLENGERFARRLSLCFADRPGPQLVHIATDGETYGHHHKHGDMALAYALEHIERDGAATLTNYGEYLERFPPEYEAEIVENSSWSCVHGVERWRSNCGCSAGGRAWSQQWRRPLRNALDALRDETAALYEDLAQDVLRDPWAARDDYIDVVLDRSSGNVDKFLAQHGRGKGSGETALALLEMQLNAMLMFTSCGWFFDELSRIETIQILRYAGRAIQLAERYGAVGVERRFLERMEEAKSNVPEVGDGQMLYRVSVSTARVDLPKLVAHYAVNSLFADTSEGARVYAYAVEVLDQAHRQSGRAQLAIGHVTATSTFTRSEATLSYGVLHFGDHNITGGVRSFKGADEYERMKAACLAAFEQGNLPETMRRLDAHFLELTYSLDTLFRSEQRKVLDQLLSDAVDEATAVSTQIYKARAPLLAYVATLNFPLPAALRATVDLAICGSLSEAIKHDDLDARRILALVAEAKRQDVELDVVGLAYALSERVRELAVGWLGAPNNDDLRKQLHVAVELAVAMPFEVDLTRAQDAYWRIVVTRGAKADDLGRLLKIRVPSPRRDSAL